MEYVTWFMENFSALFSAFCGVLTALIVLFAIIPGEQPEKALQSVLDFVKKFSNK